LLVIELSEDQVDKIFGFVERHSGLKATIDLVQQQIVMHVDPPQVFEFEIEPAIKEQLLKGLDDIAQTLQYEADIARFEESHDPLGL
jgi:3-isopropylmalate/(R)-2-methylmalate dehydratase small subunit